MAFPGRGAAIVGVYLTEQAKKIEGRTSTELQIEAVKGALADAGLSVKDVDGIATMDKASPVSGSYHPHHYWAEQLGQLPMSLIETGQGAGAMAKMAAAVSAGLADTVVYVSGKAGEGINPARKAVPKKAPRVGEWQYSITGGTHPAWYAAWARRYMHDFGVTSAQLAEVAVAARHHATLNPESLMGSKGELTIDDVLNSRMIADPLHLLDCCLDNDGGYALVITSLDRARDLKQKPVQILGGAEWYGMDYYLNIPHPWINPEGSAVSKAADRAFGIAGVSRDDIDVAGLYDCFTITTIRDIEELGFCKVGEGADFAQDGNIRLGGRLPVNTHGGLLSCSHNGMGGPAGLHTIEVVRQLRGGNVEPERQVDGARLGVTLSQGMSVHGGGGVLVLGVD
ncbi:thiolase family protein [Amycolatopsis sp. K13G38]|uniref:Thiolase family protein n=1 Tax=Amycolatopsis acididurans TaxID=2724524 RepID=A0ABX1JCU0_9PSEU|nr:thiolase family protein [Amycolatopsis acididurans]NKQ56092.1 thiolase family protein [Amycolatopsis acididurans]